MLRDPPKSFCAPATLHPRPYRIAPGAHALSRAPQQSHVLPVTGRHASPADKRLRREETVKSHTDGRTRMLTTTKRSCLFPIQQAPTQKASTHPRRCAQDHVEAFQERTRFLEFRSGRVHRMPQGGTPLPQFGDCCGSGIVVARGRSARRIGRPRDRRI